MNPQYKTLLSRVEALRGQAIKSLLEERSPDGPCLGQLSSSALSTATAVTTLELFQRNNGRHNQDHSGLVHVGLEWLASHQNADGGWGDTDRRLNNISTTTLVWAAMGLFPDWCAANESVLNQAQSYLQRSVGSIAPGELCRTIEHNYGWDRTFSIPILTMCALCGRLGSGNNGWKQIRSLPFELAALPQHWFGALQLPVVSYALPALIAIGQVRHHFYPSRNPLIYLLRNAARKTTLHRLTRLQPNNGGFLEAVPLTSFVTMSLAAMGLTDHPVVKRGIGFLEQSA